VTQIEGIRGERRAHPRFWDYCAYLLNRLREALLEPLDADLARRHNALVIDYGCGERPYESLLEGRVARYVGVDIKGNSLADVTCDSRGSVPLEDGVADIVLSTQVAHQVPDVSTYLAECFRLLRPGGLLLLSTHGYWTYHPYPRDVRRWTCWGLKYEIEQHGFLIESCNGCMGPLAYTTQLRVQLVRGALYRLRPFSTPIINFVSAIAQPIMALEDRLTPRTVREENAAIYVVAARRPT